ncbi:hypothetical protein B0F90DRAFT_702106 [Multifurca ochricompacta]|uniref:Uncharacterized protein n=1 Tax=Multifurca ochricompacta TaxID=376703 RepID=A0AAD4QJQ8_9AGAM|nr:hypothetical protein B0F90DRAFT_702106 [Multifurca ochricompacta]
MVHNCGNVYVRSGEREIREEKDSMSMITPRQMSNFASLVGYLLHLKALSRTGLRGVSVMSMIPNALIRQICWIRLNLFKLGRSFATFKGCDTQRDEEMRGEKKLIPCVGSDFAALYDISLFLHASPLLPLPSTTFNTGTYVQYNLPPVSGPGSHQKNYKCPEGRTGGNLLLRRTQSHRINLSGTTAMHACGML